MPPDRAEAKVTSRIELPYEELFRLPGYARKAWHGQRWLLLHG
jgi:hypothetical protein